MALKKILKKKISTRCKLFKDLMYIKGWTKHIPTDDDCLDGFPAKEGEVFYILHDNSDKTYEIYQDFARKIFVVKMMKGHWYEVPVENLEILKRERIAARGRVT